MPWINLTLRRGAFTKTVQHAVMAKLTDALMFWEKIPDTPEARKKTMGWVHEVAEDSDYNSGTHNHDDPFYFIEVRLLAGRFRHAHQATSHPGFHEDNYARRGQDPFLGRRQQSMGAHRRTAKRRLGHRRTYRLAS